jgi:hypothetical protein
LLRDKSGNGPDKSQFWTVWGYANASGSYFPGTKLNVTAETAFGTNQEGVGLVATILSVRFRESYIKNSSTTPEKLLPIVTSCDLTYCVQRRNATRVINGKLDDFEVPTVPLQVTHDRCFLLWVPGAGVSDGVLLAHASDELPPRFPEACKDSTIDALPSGEGIYWLNDSVLRRYVYPALQLALTSKTFDPDMRTFVTTKSRISLTPSLEAELIAWTNSASTWGATAYYSDNGNVSQTMSRMARSISNMLRQDASSYNVSGTVLAPVVYVQVRWSWLIYPASTVLLAVIFLVLTIAFSDQRRAPIWKSSSLAIAFHVYRGIEGQEDASQDLQEMEKLAKHKRVRMSTDEHGKTKLEDINKKQRD